MEYVVIGILAAVAIVGWFRAWVWKRAFHTYMELDLEEKGVLPTDAELEAKAEKMAEKAVNDLLGE